MLHAQVTPRAPPDGSNYQTLPTATPNHSIFCIAVGWTEEARDEWGVGVRKGPGKGKVTKAWKSVGGGRPATGSRVSLAGTRAGVIECREGSTV